MASPEQVHSHDRILLAWVRDAVLGELVIRRLAERALDVAEVERWAQVEGLDPVEVSAAVMLVTGARCLVRWWRGRWRPVDAW